MFAGENATVPDRREVGGSGAETRGVSQKLRHCAREAAVHAWEVLWGVAMMLCVCLSWVGATQLAKVTFRKVNAPFALTWFASTWNIFFFPLYYLGHLCKGGERQTPRQCYRECSRFFGAAGLTVKAFLLKVAPFGVLWTLSTYLYLQALRRIPSTDAAALFCCSKAFVFLLSWIVLRDRFLGVRIVAAILAIAGIVMMTYADGIRSHSLVGISLAVASASLSAVYKVLFKLILGSAEVGEAALFLTVLGCANMIVVSFLPAVLYALGTERFGPSPELPWACLCGVALLLLGFNVLVNFGIAVTFPTVISLGVVLTVPLNALVDVYTCAVRFNSVRLIAVLAICLGFLLLLLPEDWDQGLMRMSACLCRQHQPAEDDVELGAGSRPSSRSSSRPSSTPSTAPNSGLHWSQSARMPKCIVGH
ncbi:solute carrier family 35 member F3-like [Scleropages formosus]|uniref:Solute carrier family 35 member F3-like n=1 Tax=Scleropages formosus TaxID=113540 RepID=A0A0P7UFL7_SCLFO|nr:solute carrier family 35 member F3-like [Scleropages formosus]